MAVRGLLGAGLISVEFSGQAAAAQPFLERLMECLGIGLRVISRIANDVRMVVDDDTQEGREGFSAVGRIDKCSVPRSFRELSPIDFRMDREGVRGC